MIFSKGEARAGEWIVPLVSKKGVLLDRWSIGLVHSSGVTELEDYVMRPEICAMICQLFRLPRNFKIRSVRKRIIRSSVYHKRLDMILKTKDWRYRGVLVPQHITVLSEDARLQVPQHAIDVFTQEHPSVRPARPWRTKGMKVKKT